MIVYISIGNSDDKLSQADWAGFVQDTHDAVNDAALKVHGEWFSAPTSSYQNACWCVEIAPDSDGWMLKSVLADLAVTYGQDSIAWAEAPTTEFLGAAK